MDAESKRLPESKESKGLPQRHNVNRQLSSLNRQVNLLPNWAVKNQSPSFSETDKIQKGLHDLDSPRKIQSTRKQEPSHKNKSERLKDTQFRLQRAKKFQTEAYELASRKCYSEGIEKLSKAMNLLPHQWKLYATRAQFHVANNNIEKALMDYAEALQYAQAQAGQSHPPTNTERDIPASLHSKRAQLLAKAGTNVAALEDMNSACNLCPGNGVYHFQRGLHLLYRMDRPDDALADLTVAKQSRTHLDFDTSVQMYYQRGLCLHMLGRVPEAIEDLEVSHQMTSTFTPCCMALASCYLDIGDIPKAERMLFSASEMEPQDDKVYFSCGMLHYQKMEYERAIKDFEKAVMIAPSEPAYRFHLGRSLLQLCTQNTTASSQDAMEVLLQRALDCFEEAVSLDPCQTEYLHSAGLAHIRLKDFEKGVAFLSMALKQDPNFLPSVFYLGIAQHQMGNFLLSKEQYDTVASSVQDDYRLFEARALTLFELGEWLQCCDDLTKALSLAPHRIANLYKRGQCFHQLNQYEEALDDINRVLHETTDSVYRERLQSDNTRSSVFESSSPYLLQIPNQAHILSARALVYRSIGRWKEAIQDLRQAILLDSRSHDLYFNQGMCLMTLGHWEEALQSFRLGHQKATRCSAPETWTFLAQMGICQFNAMEYDEAVAAFDAALEEGAEDITEEALKIYSLKGRALVQTKEHDLAVKAFSNALEAANSFGENVKCNCLYERAKTYLLQRNYQEALQDFDEVIRIDPTNARAHFMRGWAYKGLQQFDKAVEDFQHCRELDPINPYLVVDYKKVHQIECIVLND